MLKIEKRNDWLLNMNKKEQQKYGNDILELGYKITNSIKTNFYFDSPINESISNLENLLKNQNNNLNKSLENQNNNLNKSLEYFSENLKNKTDIICNKLKVNETSFKEIKLGFDKGIDKVSETVINLTGQTKISSIKGKIGETFIENTIKQHFPDDSVVIKAQNPHESDIEYIENNSDLKILIESKFYKNTVGSKEIQKFEDDLSRSGINYGIFISLNSFIVGKKRFQVEKKNKKIVVFIPNAGFNQYSIICSLLLIKELHKYNIKNNLNFINIDEKCLQIYNSLSFLDNIWENIQKLSFDTRKTKECINKSLETLHNNVIELEISTKNIMKQIKHIISDNLIDLNEKCIEIIDTDDLDNFIIEFKFSEKIKIQLKKLENIIKFNKANLIRIGQKLLINKNDKNICKIKINKKNILLESKNPTCTLEFCEKNENLIKYILT